MNGALASGTTGRHLTADLGSSLLGDVAAAATSNPSAIFANVVQSIVSQAQNFSQFNQGQLGDFSAPSPHERISVPLTIRV